MKTSIMLIVLITILISACKSDKIRSFIPGTYVNSASGEYSVVDDTLYIEPSGSNNYVIHRKTGFNTIDDGKKSKRQFESERWIAIYDEATKAMTETRRGKVITFYPESNTLKLSKRKYQKIN
jgi:thioredoxin reductase